MATQPRTEITVGLGERAYPIWIGEHCLDRLPALIEATGTRGAIGLVTDSNVGPLYADTVAAHLRETGRVLHVHTLVAGEAHKRLDAIEAICGDFLAAGLDRSSCVVALGGGVVGDIAGFAAAVFMRGVPVLQVPTTIVAQVDSSVGGKTGVNHPLSKNSIGAFHQPAGVLIDIALLESLPAREWRAGMAEVIKHGVIADADLFAYLEREAATIMQGDRTALRYPIVRSCEIKSAVVAADEREAGVRANLNYGHTFGHAIEAVTQYTRFLHGEAVALGMVAAGALGRGLGLVDDTFVARQRACIEAYGLPTRWPDLPIDETLVAMHKDKKARAGTLTLIVPVRLGEVAQRTDVPEAAVREALAALTVED